MNQDLEIVITPDGNGRCVYGEAIELSELGALLITRASTVEPDDTGKWLADLQAVGGPHLGPFTTRSQALSAESRWLAEHWLPTVIREPGGIQSGKQQERDMSEFMPPIRWIKPLHPIGPANDPPSRLLGQVQILDADFHVNAEQVMDMDREDDTCQEPVAGIGDTYVEEIQALCEGPGETVRIGNRKYLLVISPFQK